MTHKSPFAIISLVLTAGCAAPRAGDPASRRGDEIVAAGRFFHTGTPVVLWLDEGGFDAYRVERRFGAAETLPSRPTPGTATPARYGRRSTDALGAETARAVERDGWSLDALRSVVTQFVIHYDVCGTSRQCFRTLQDVRGLSVHFMLDVDGTIYQTLDLKERARHAGAANDRSVGIEIAHIGAWPDMEVISRWYAPDGAGGTVLTLPERLREDPRRHDVVLRPVRPEPVRGRIQDQDLLQYDFTPEQYDALIHLAAALARVFPNMPLEAPRGEDGRILDRALTPEALATFRGLLGHWHVTRNKIDPGPAFDWERVLRDARRLAGPLRNAASAAVIAGGPDSPGTRHESP